MSYLWQRSNPAAGSPGRSSLGASSAASQISSQNLTTRPFASAARATSACCLPGSPTTRMPVLVSLSSKTCSTASSRRLAWTTTSPGSGCLADALSAAVKKRGAGSTTSGEAAPSWSRRSGKTVDVEGGRRVMMEVASVRVGKSERSPAGSRCKISARAPSSSWA